MSNEIDRYLNEPQVDCKANCKCTTECKHVNEQGEVEIQLNFPDVQVYDLLDIAMMERLPPEQIEKIEQVNPVELTFHPIRGELYIYDRSLFVEADTIKQKHTHINTLIKQLYGPEFMKKIRRKLGAVKFLELLGVGAFGKVFSFYVNDTVHILKVQDITETHVENNLQLLLSNFEYYINLKMYIYSLKSSKKHPEHKGFRVAMPVKRFLIESKETGKLYYCIETIGNESVMKYGMMGDILQDKLSKNRLYLILDFIKQMIKHFCEIKITHGDFHWNNFSYVIEKDNSLHPFVIDYGNSIDESCDPLIELFMLLYSLKLCPMHIYNKRILAEGIIKMIIYYIDTDYNYYDIKISDINDPDRVARDLYYQLSDSLIERVKEFDPKIIEYYHKEISRLRKQLRERGIRQ